MNQRIRESDFLNNYYNITSITYSYNSDLTKTGRFALNKYIIFLKILIKTLTKVLQKRPECIYFQISCFGPSFYRDSIIILLLKLMNKKILLHIRVKGFKNNIKTNTLKYKYYKYIFSGVYLICLSRLLVDDLKHIANGKIYVVNNGIPLIKKYRKKKMHETLRITFFSNLLYSKGIQTFIEAISLLIQEDIKFRAYIAGDKADLDSKKLNIILNKYNLNNYIEYIGPQYDEKKHNLLSDTSLLIFPTLNDAFPGVVLDAMQYEIPVITTNEGALPEIVDNGKTGFIVSKDNPEEIVEKVLFFYTDRKKLISFGKNARSKFLQEYTFEIFEENMKNVFNMVLDG